MYENIQYEVMLLFGKPVLFVPWRIRPADVPEGLIRYELRHDDEGGLCEVKDKVIADYFGTILAKEPIEPREIDGAEYSTLVGINIEREDYCYFDYKYSLEDYITRYNEICVVNRLVQNCVDDENSVLGAEIQKNRQARMEEKKDLHKYKVAFSGFIYVEAGSADDAKEVCLEGMDDCACAYSQLLIDSVNEVDEFIVPITEAVLRTPKGKEEEA